jgi:trigger factor
MQVTKEPLEPCQVALTIEVEGNKVVSAVDKAYREYAKYVAVPGFRKGKAPMPMVRQRIPVADVRQRAAEILVEPAYEEALTQENIEPYGQPKLELLQLDLEDKPFIFKAVVPLPPHVELGQYSGLTVERKKYEMDDEDVDKQLERLRERAADYPKVERPVENGDLVIADVSAITDVRPEAADPRPTMLEIGADNIPGFDEQLVGMNIDDEKTFTLTYPSDYPEEDLAGETAEFTVKINEVRTKDIPPLDDALAVKITNGKFETLEAFKADLKRDMEKSLHDSAENEADGAMIEQIVVGSTIHYPPQLVEAEVNQDAQNLLSRLEREGVSLDDYLERTGRTREQIMAEFQDAANKRIQIGLVLGEVAEKENLAITDADVEAALAEQAEQQRTTPAAVRALMERNGQLEGLRNRAQTKKVLDFLRAATIIEEKVVKAGEVADEEDDAESPVEDEAVAVPAENEG